MEILVALAVIAIAISAVVTSISTHVGIASHLRDRTYAGWVGMNKYNELLIKGEWPSSNNLSGTTLFAEHEWAWKVTTKDTDDPDVRRFDISIYRKEGDENPLTTFIAYVGRPNEPLATKK